LDFRRFNSDREAVIRRAEESDVVAIVNVGADLASSRAAIGLAEQYDFVYAAVGVHPHSAKKVARGVLNELRTLARHPKVVAIGEIGLDYYRDLSPRPVQRTVFTQQLELATELGLPVVVHSRDAYEDVLEELRRWEGTGVVHSYSGGTRFLNDTLALGFYVGISGPVTFPKASQLREVASKTALDRLLVETDCPYLTPVPFRGRRNEPAYVKYVVDEIARARGESAVSVAQVTSENAGRLFGGLGI
jgi:TatD DNase family protein